jgi:hypothetical protein
MTDETPEQEHPGRDPEDTLTGSDDAGGPFTWPPGKADLPKRFVAALIDGVIAVLVGMIPWIGGIVSAAYWVLRDGMEFDFMDHRSVGKKVMKLRPLTADGQRLDMMMSVRRNWMFGFGGLIQFLLYIPLIGWLLILPVALVALVIGVIEIIKVVTDEEGRRFGDVWANTKVVEVDA